MEIKKRYQVTKIRLFCSCNEETESCYIETFLGETFNKAILDSGRTEAVCGNVWLNVT